MKKLTLVLLSAVMSLYGFSQSTIMLDSTVLTVDTLIDGIDVPWEIVWGPDDHIWMTERYGLVSRVNPEDGSRDVLLDLSDDIYENGEAGLLALLLHPDWQNSPYVYLVYTYVEGYDILERLVRYTYENNILVNEEIILDGIQGYNTHDGSRLLLLPDNTLLMTTGDAQEQNLPQNTNSIVGKTLRLNLDGSIPDDNPIPGSLVWSYGHRNAQGLCIGPNDIIYSSEHGPTTDDELNILSPNKNYGWPEVEGYCDSPPEQSFCNDNEVIEPIAAWSPTIAPSDIIWYDHPSIPELENRLLMTVLKEKVLVAFTMNEEGTVVIAEDWYLEEMLGRLRDVCVSPSGDIILATNGNTWGNDNPFEHNLVRLRNLNYNPEDTVQNSISSGYFNMLSISPNPSDGLFQIRHIPAVHIAIYNSAGRMMYQKQVSSPADSLDIDLRSFESGVYFIHFSDNGNVHMEKVVKY